MPRLGLTAIVAIALGASAAPASALTLGQLAPPGTLSPPACTGVFDVAQPTVTSGNTFVVPSAKGVTDWTVTSWSTVTTLGGQQMSIKFFRKVGEPLTYMAVAQDPLQILAAGDNKFATDLRVQAGDVLGAHSQGGECAFEAPGETIVYVPNKNIANGDSAPFATDVNYRLNLQAELTPTSDFTLGKPKSKPNGTAVLVAQVPNPGAITVVGKGVKGSSAGAVSAKKVKAAGKVKLVIRAKGKQSETLADSGKVTVKPKVKFTPAGGTASTESRKVKLHD